MRKNFSRLLIFLLLFMVGTTFVACEKPSGGPFSLWDSYGGGVGANVPEPYEDYEILATKDYLHVEVCNVTENDFYSYVSRCQEYGFIGEIGTAETPDIYFMAEHKDGIIMEVFFYEQDSYYYVYAIKKS